ncbi:hypothetical protein Sa4125_32540 [Aureimonas sp. SA4125]|nr:hypothetical protein Sa4125_32540 [Aureimonas sp. SA4125]
MKGRDDARRTGLDDIGKRDKVTGTEPAKAFLHVASHQKSGKEEHRTRREGEDGEKNPSVEVLVDREQCLSFIFHEASRNQPGCTRSAPPGTVAVTIT